MVKVIRILITSWKVSSGLLGMKCQDETIQARAFLREKHLKDNRG
jgi:hypothetical protein